MLCEAIVVRVCFKLSSPVQQETLGATLDKLLTSTRETTEFLQVQLDENAIPDVQFRRLGPDLLQMMNRRRHVSLSTTAAFSFETRS